MRKKIIKGFIAAGFAFAVYMIGTAFVCDSEAWVRCFAYIVGVIMAFACGMIIEGV